jgi:hypothetical protein
LIILAPAGAAACIFGGCEAAASGVAAGGAVGGLGGLLAWLNDLAGDPAGDPALDNGGSTACPLNQSPSDYGEPSPTIEVNGQTYIYGQRVLARMAEEPGPYHNFPFS